MNMTNKTFPTTTSTTTNPSWTGTGSNVGLFRQRPVTNQLSHCTALANTVSIILYTEFLVTHSFVIVVSKILTINIKKQLLYRV